MTLHRSETSQRAKSYHDGLSENFDSTHFDGTHVPMEEPSTASEADIGHTRERSFALLLFHMSTEHDFELH